MFPETIETDSLTLNPLREEYVDVFGLYDLFAEKSEGVAGVFEYVPQEPYTSVKRARDQLAEVETAWEEAETAQYAVYTSSDDLAGYAVLSIADHEDDDLTITTRVRF